MDDVAAVLREAAPRVLADEPVAFAYLFGSHATGTAIVRSDVDIAVHLASETAELDVDLLDLRFRLAAALEREAGVGPVEVVVLDEAPIALAGRVLADGVVVYSRDEPMRVRYVSVTTRSFHDFAVHEERSARERLARLASGT